MMQAQPNNAATSAPRWNTLGLGAVRPLPSAAAGFDVSPVEATALRAGLLAQVAEANEDARLEGEAEIHPSVVDEVMRIAFLALAECHSISSPSVFSTGDGGASLVYHNRDSRRRVAIEVRPGDGSYSVLLTDLSGSKASTQRREHPFNSTRFNS